MCIVYVTAVRNRELHARAYAGAIRILPQELHFMLRQSERLSL